MLLQPTVMVRAGHLLYVVALAMMAFWGPIDPAGAGGARFAPGEVMIKFRPGTPPAEALTRASRGDPPDVQDLAPASRLLSEQTGLPLQARQLLSGDWALFAIDLDRLTVRTAEELLKQQDVADVKRRIGDTEARHPDAPVFEVAFRSGSAPARLLEQQATGAPDKAAAELAARYGERLGVPLRGTASASTKRLLFEIDLEKLTSDLAERLRSLVDIVDTVELNYIMMPM